jgi:hypothetical protein
MSTPDKMFWVVSRRKYLLEYFSGRAGTRGWCRQKPIASASTLLLRGYTEHPYRAEFSDEMCFLAGKLSAGRERFIMRSLARAAITGWNILNR